MNRKLSVAFVADDDSGDDDEDYGDEALAREILDVLGPAEHPDEHRSLPPPEVIERIHARLLATLALPAAAVTTLSAEPLERKWAMIKVNGILSL